jgi:succinyl-CoA synthetase beta subunit
LLKLYGLKVPNGFVASTLEEVCEVSRKVSYPAMVKAQVHATGRLKAGGIKTASNTMEVEDAARSLLGSSIRGFKVDKVLIEEKLDIMHEFYLGIIVNDSYRVRAQTLIFSVEGGVDIEEVASRSPEKIRSVAINPLSGFDVEDFKRELSTLQISSSIANMISDAAYRLFKLSKGL